VKYTCLIFDSTTEPILRVPNYKVDKALAMIDYVLAQHKPISRLSLAVVVGVLESMVEATPSRVGHTYLRHLHTILHPADWDGNDLSYFPSLRWMNIVSRILFFGNVCSLRIKVNVLVQLNREL
jgi:hypothetical protein